MFYTFMEIIGTIAFAVSGALVGIQKKMDILGVCTLGIITAVGGGVIRDIIIGTIPPTAFRNPIYIFVAIFTAIIVFLPFVGKRINPDHFLWILADSIGLGAFTMTGVLTGVSFNNIFLEVFLGVLTGVGGGVLRDICSQEIPMIFIKHFYACPCIIGAAITAVLIKYYSQIAIAIGFAIIIILRLLAAKFKWHLSKAK